MLSLARCVCAVALTCPRRVQTSSRALWHTRRDAPLSAVFDRFAADQRTPVSAWRFVTFDGDTIARNATAASIHMEDEDTVDAIRVAPHDGALD